jgi:hypothetical protein
MLIRTHSHRLLIAATATQVSFIRIGEASVMALGLLSHLTVMVDLQNGADIEADEYQDATHLHFELEV